MQFLCIKSGYNFAKRWCSRLCIWSFLDNLSKDLASRIYWNINILPEFSSLISNISLVTWRSIINGNPSPIPWLSLIFAETILLSYPCWLPCLQPHYFCVANLRNMNQWKHCLVFRLIGKNVLSSYLNVNFYMWVYLLVPLSVNGAPKI